MSEVYTRAPGTPVKLFDVRFGLRVFCAVWGFLEA
jgi:hypothetical protein